MHNNHENLKDCIQKKEMFQRTGKNTTSLSSSLANQKPERVFGHGMLGIDHRRKILFKYIFNIYF